MKRIEALAKKFNNMKVENLEALIEAYENPDASYPDVASRESDRKADARIRTDMHRASYRR